jgi:hypothetical protein
MKMGNTRSPWRYDAEPVARSCRQNFDGPRSYGSPFVYIGAAGQIALEDLSESPLRVALIVVGVIFTAWAVFIVTRRTEAVLAFDLATTAAQRGSREMTIKVAAIYVDMSAVPRGLKID